MGGSKQDTSQQSTVKETSTTDARKTINITLQQPSFSQTEAAALLQNLSQSNAAAQSQMGLANDIQALSQGAVSIYSGTVAPVAPFALEIGAILIGVFLLLKYGLGKGKE